MTLEDLQKKLCDYRIKHNCDIVIEWCGVVVVRLVDRDTGKLIKETGATNLLALDFLLNLPPEKWV